ncbi:hypothetical protein MHU86_13371 [Fragilaria crotonensis]|nr:hypothetical protein MHU86_13371 [Fragilaria crotonensis]
MLRQDASITAEDVVNFLLSRHGIKADLTYVERNLMPGLAGNIDESPDAVFDIVELASILLIPHLRKTGAEHDCEMLFDKVLKMITLDVTGSSDPVRLDRTMMLNIMKTYGEEDVSSAVVDEMLKAAGVQKNGSTMFDYKKLVNATTADIQQYDPEWETRETTYYDDVLDANLEDNDPDEELAKSNFDDAPDKIRRIFTLPTIDTVAENYRSKTFNVLLWVFVVVALFQYASDFDTSVGQQDCPTTSFMSEFGCHVGNSIVAWLMLMVQLIIMGTIFVILSTAGNSIHLQHNLPSFVGVMLGIVTIMFSSMLSYIFEVKFFLINTNKSSSAEGQFGFGFALALGCVLLLFQIKSLLYVLIPRSTWKNLPFANFWMTCEMAKSECCTKQAAAYKIKNMVDHAFAQHDGSILRKAESARVKLKASSFFRKNPIGGNVLMLALECWSLGLTLGIMFFRTMKLLLVTSFYIGRLDTPLFAPGVGMIGPLIVDGHPVQFRKGLLLHDAHRHPYMERLGVIYLLKLKYGVHFANRAGGQWRLIFVMALMPWLRRYRLDDSITKYAGTNEEFRDEQPHAAHTDAGIWVPLMITDPSIDSVEMIDYF